MQQDVQQLGGRVYKHTTWELMTAVRWNTDVLRDWPCLSQPGPARRAAWLPAAVPLQPAARPKHPRTCDRLPGAQHGPGAVRVEAADDLARQQRLQQLLISAP